LEQAIETAPDTVVVQGRKLGVSEPECLGSEPRRPFSDAVEGFTSDEHVLEQEGNADRGSDPAASVCARQVRAEELLEAHPFEDSIDDGQCADSARVQCAALGASDLTWAWGDGGTGDVASFGFWHWCGS
jgi:hypothetical protein